MPLAAVDQALGVAIEPYDTAPPQVRLSLQPKNPVHRLPKGRAFRLLLGNQVAHHPHCGPSNPLLYRQLLRHQGDLLILHLLFLETMAHHPQPSHYVIAKATVIMIPSVRYVDCIC